MIGVIIDLQGISRISFVCHVAVSQRSQNWDIGDLKVRRIYFAKKIKSTGSYDKEPGCIKGHKYDAKWHKNCVKLSNMYELK